jgi:hypothetical protein
MPDTDTPDAVAAPVAAPAPAPAAAVSPPVNAAAPAVSPPANAPAAEPAPEPPGFWAEGWRERLAGDDTKALKQLGRYASPEDIWKKARALESRLSSGELRPVLGKDASEAEVKEYRQALGIPAAPDKYDLKDVKIDESDKPFIAEVMKDAHATNQTAEQVAATVNAWNRIKTAAIEKQADTDKVARAKMEDTLREEWGTDYRGHMNRIENLLNTSGSQEMKDLFLGGRLADAAGTPIGSSPEAMKLLLRLALIDNPANIVVPAGHANPIKTIEDELASINKVMVEDRKRYNKDEAMQARWRELTEAQQKLKARGAV